MSTLATRLGRQGVPRTPCTPHEIAGQIGRVLERLSLPEPLGRGHVRVVPWSPTMHSDEGHVGTLPVIAWHVIESLPLPKRPQPVAISHPVVTAPGAAIQYYQLDIVSTIEFTCFASTSEEAGTLSWWLIYQLFWYKSLFGQYGMQHLQYLESRAETLALLPKMKIPAVPVRISMQTSMLFTVPQDILEEITITTSSTVNTYGEELVVFGDDVLTNPRVSAILSVTSEDGTQAYTPRYDLAAGRFSWDLGQPTPRAGEPYRVRYLYYGACDLRVTQMVAPLE